MGFDTYREIEIVRDGAILRVVLNRPNVLNAVSERLHTELSTVFSDADRDPNSRVVVLTGAGRAFSSGGDVEWMEQLAAEPHRHAPLAREAREIVFTLLDMSKPTIAAINGPAIGLGATIALLCDITIMAESAKIADTHVRIGLVAGDGGALIWPRLVGYAKAKECLLTGRALDGREAERIGLVSRCVPDAALEEEVGRTAHSLAAGAALAIAGTKRVLNLSLKREAQEIMDAGLANEMATMRSKDHAAAVRAFKEKLKPTFKGE